MDIRDFCSEDALVNSHNGEKGYMAAFSVTNMETDELIKHIKSNTDFNKLSLNHREIICVAVNVIL